MSAIYRINRHRKLRIESLESRCVFATAEFTVNLYQDNGGVVGALIENDTIAVGDTFFVEITAKEFDPEYTGLASTSLDIKWDPTVLQEIDDTFDPTDVNSPIITSDFPMFRQGTLDNGAGTIENLSAMAFLSSQFGRAIGDGIPERFSLLKFRAIASSEAATIDITQGRSRIATVQATGLSNKQIRFETQAINVKPRQAIDNNPQTPATLPTTSIPISTDPVPVVPDNAETGKTIQFDSVPVIKEQEYSEPSQSEPNIVDSAISSKPVEETFITEPEAIADPITPTKMPILPLSASASGSGLDTDVTTPIIDFEAMCPAFSKVPDKTLTQSTQSLVVPAASEKKTSDDLVDTVFASGGFTLNYENAFEVMFVQKRSRNKLLAQGERNTYSL